MDAYRQADEEHRVPWPVLAAMGQVLTEHGARSPYDTLQRTDDQRFPTVDPPIAPGSAPTATESTCRLRLVGDSLLAGMEAALAGAVSASCAVVGLDAREGRTIAEGADALRQDPPGDATAIAVVLGTNDLAAGAGRQELDRRIDDLVTVATAGGTGDRRSSGSTSAATGLAADAGTLTAALIAAQRRHPTLQVADWAAHLAALPEDDAAAHRAGDGVHYTPAATRRWPDGSPASSPPRRSGPSTRRPATAASARSCSTPPCSPACPSNPPRASSARSACWPGRWPGSPSGPQPAAPTTPGPPASPRSSCPPPRSSGTRSWPPPPWWRATRPASSRTRPCRSPRSSRSCGAARCSARRRRSGPPTAWCRGPTPRTSCSARPTSSPPPGPTGVPAPATRPSPTPACSRSRAPRWRHAATRSRTSAPPPASSSTRRAARSSSARARPTGSGPRPAGPPWRPPSATRRRTASSPRARRPTGSTRATRARPG